MVDLLYILCYFDLNSEDNMVSWDFALDLHDFDGFGEHMNYFVGLMHAS